MARPNKRRIQQLQSANTERRASTRFPVTLEVRYTTSGLLGPVKMGTGRTIDLSSSGLSFITDTPLLTGQKITAYIDWPALLDGDIKLQLVIWGVVVRTNGPEVALQIQGHDFRTRSAGQRSPRELLG